MSALREQTRDLLRLIGRSPKDADGWAKVSPVLAQAVRKWSESELCEIEGADDAMRIRLTAEGTIVRKWLA